MSDKVPNLFLSRLSKESLYNRPRKTFPWLWLVFLIVATLAVIYWWKRSALEPTPASLATAAPGPVMEGPAPQPTTEGLTTPPVSQTPAEKSPSQIDAALPPTENPPLLEWNGVDCKIREPRDIIIRGRNSWNALWQEMGNLDSAPRINFYNYVIVGVFLGEQSGSGKTVTIGEPQETDSDYIVLTQTVPQTATMEKTSGPSAPYHLKVIPRTAKPVRIVHARGDNHKEKR